MNKKIEIENFKSLKSISIELSRINVLIGAPNSGKSNILEALFFFGLPHVAYEIKREIENPEENYSTKNFLSELMSKCIRYSSENTFLDLFHQWSAENTIKIRVEDISVEARLKEGNLVIDGFTLDKISELSKIGEKILPARFYSFREFKPETSYSQFIPFYLLPDGRNFNNTISTIPEIRVWLDRILREKYNLALAVTPSSRDVKIIDAGTNVWPELIADGLKRFIYFYVAVASNDFYAQQYDEKPVILLEEPELKMYPDLINILVDRIIESKNYFIITTHNPYLLSAFIGSKKLRKNELKIFSVSRDVENMTKIKEISLKKVISEKLMSAYEIIANVEEI
ncbi:MAG: hypothetical protein B6D55_04935 [Candidatus Omnitrophica bacterium 4484_70.2]|nr:MAG: hypothetical protein B6D55_04935 [Candidatus Omnitrophica bacterium 4484_70.2]